MSFPGSLRNSKLKIIFLSHFALSSLLPILIAVLIVDELIIPLLGESGYDRLGNDLYVGLLVMLFFPLLSFFLMYRRLHRLESLTAEITAKATAVTNREERFAAQKIHDDQEFTPDKTADLHEENEIQALIRSFNNIFQTATDQLSERNHLRELLARLIAISSNLMAELDFDRLFPMIIGNVTEAMLAERTTMYVVDRQKGELWSKVAEGIGQVRLPLGRGISGRVAATGEIINAVDAWELPYFDRSFDLENNFRTRAVLCVPIRSRTREIIGVIQVINKLDKYCFDAEDEVFLKGLSSQIAIALENSLLVDEIFLSFTSSISTLSAMVDAKHRFTAGHSERVKDYALLIAEKMQLPKEEVEVLKYAALLHDIGKIGVRDDVLTKNGQFSPEDWEEMKTHPAKTKAILDKFHFPRSLTQVPSIACHHHEKVNGTGYPDGLTSDELPLGSKIIAVADVFDALTSQRDYPKYALGQTMNCAPMPLDDVIELLQEQSGSQFDPQVVAAFLQSLPQALLLHRGTHFSPAYVDAKLHPLTPEKLPEDALSSPPQTTVAIP